MALSVHQPLGLAGADGAEGAGERLGVQLLASPLWDNRRGAPPPTLPLTLTELRLSALPFLGADGFFLPSAAGGGGGSSGGAPAKFAPHVVVKTWGADGLPMVLGEGSATAMEEAAIVCVGKASIFTSA